MRVMPMWALVPVRALAEGKKRLAPLMSPEERAVLAKTMLEDVLDCLGRAPAIEGIAVVTDDPTAAALALDYRALVLPDAPPCDKTRGGLNASLEGAAAWLRATRAEATMLIMHADLPAACPEDIAALAAVEAVARSARANPPDVVLARAHDGGTNALKLRPGVLLPFAFGADSCARHFAAARAAGLSVAVLERAALALDLDRPEDVAAYL
ncbi:MAG: 2-phospho-L-lactate guanylyltransferase, partial [Pseudomonadota bacterium]